MDLSSDSHRCTVTLVAGTAGQAEVHKRGSTTEAAQRLAREATALRRARHPGVVDLVELRPEPEADGAVLVTRLAGTHTLATWAPPTIDEAAGILVALAETLADLHHLGIAHGAVAPEHVIIDAAGRPVLCGFERTRDHRPAEDVAALGVLTRRLLGTDADQRSRPDRPTRREPRRDAGARRRLLELADQAGDPDEHARPGARRFAAAVLAAVPDAAIGARPVTDGPWSGEAPAARAGHAAAAPAALGVAPAHDRSTSGPVPAPDPATEPDPDGAGEEPVDLRPGHADPHPGPPGSPEHRPDAGHGAAGPGRRVLRTGAAVVGLACLVFGGLSAWTGERPRLAASSGAAPAPIVPAGAGGPDGSVAPEAAASSTAAVSDAHGASDGHDPRAAESGRCAGDIGDDHDGDECARVVAGGIVDHDGQRYALGGPGDELVLGDPRCPHPPAVALVRPDEGTVYLFDRWARLGDEVVPRRVADVAVGSRWQRRPLDRDGCAPLVLAAPGAAPVVVDPAAAPPSTAAPAPSRADPGGSP